MNNIALHLLANTYSAFSPMLSTASAICKVNGKEVACPQFLYFLVPAIPLIVIAVFVFVIITVWKIFTKAGQPGWASIVPVYNLVVLLQVVNKPTWWILLAFVPIANIFVGLYVVYELGRVFGKGIGFTLGLIFLPIIFYPILAFGKSSYMPMSQTQKAI